MLYIMDMMNLHHLPPESVLNNNIEFFKGMSKDEKNMIISLVQKTVDEKPTIDETIQKNLIGWKLERLLPIDRNLLRLGLAEAHLKTPKAIIIDDIIRIAKKYGSEESYKMVNAILDKVLK
ncbi:MAG: transcription antitermination factor NusB [bacterium]|nr:transcription antitermination factor NusB [bacterium]